MANTALTLHEGSINTYKNLTVASTGILATAFAISKLYNGYTVTFTKFSNPLNLLFITLTHLFDKAIPNLNCETIPKKISFRIIKNLSVAGVAFACVQGTALALGLNPLTLTAAAVYFTVYSIFNFTSKVLNSLKIYQNEKEKFEALQKELETLTNNSTLGYFVTDPSLSLEEEKYEGLIQQVKENTWSLKSIKSVCDTEEDNLPTEVKDSINEMKEADELFVKSINPIRIITAQAKLFLENQKNRDHISSKGTVWIDNEENLSSDKIGFSHQFQFSLDKNLCGNIEKLDEVIKIFFGFQTEHSKRIREGKSIIDDLKKYSQTYLKAFKRMADSRIEFTNRVESFPVWMRDGLREQGHKNFVDGLDSYLQRQNAMMIDIGMAYLSRMGRG